MKAARPCALLALLAACRQQAATEPTRQAPQASAVSQEQAPPAMANRAAEAAGPIPAAFHGRWGMVATDCTSTKGDNKGLIIVGPDSIAFYESRARLTKIRGDYPENFTGDFAFTGEGQSWTRTMNIKLTGSSNTLIRTDQDPPGRYAYHRCQAARSP